MSISAMVAVRDYSLAYAADYVVLLMIADQINDDMQHCWCSVERIARYSRIAKSTTYLCIARLREIGELVVVEHKGKTSDYFIPILQDEDGYAPAKCAENHLCNGYHTPLSVRRSKKPMPAPRDPGYKRSKAKLTMLASGGVQNLEDSSNQRAPESSTPSPDSRGVIPDSRGVIPDSRGDSLISPYISLSNRLDARAREESTLSEKNGRDAEAGPEHRSKWHAITAYLAERGVSQSQLATMTTAHLYGLGPGMWRLYVPRGIDAAMFRSRYEDLIVDALSALEHRANQLVEFAS